MFDPEKHHRRSIRLKGYDYAQAGAYFVTIVAQGRQSFFGKITGAEMFPHDAGRMIITVWVSLPERFINIELGAFIVMPNHFHAILYIVGTGFIPALHGRDSSMADVADATGATLVVAPTVGQIIGAFKSITTHEYIKGVDGLGWPRFDKRLWQRNYYEHIIRSAKGGVHPHPAWS